MSKPTFCCFECGKLSVNDRAPRAKKYCSRTCYNVARSKKGYSYHAIHTWLWRNHQHDKTGKCKHCWRVTRTDWANKLDQYTLNINNYVELCRQCHEIYDGKSHDLFKGHKHTKKSKAQIAESVRRNRWQIYQQ